MPSFSAAKVSVSEPGFTPSSSRLPVVLATDVVGEVRVGDRAQDVHPAAGDRAGTARRRLHRDEREHLEDVILDDVAQRADVVVEAAAASIPNDSARFSCTASMWCRFHTGSNSSFANRR